LINNEILCRQGLFKKNFLYQLELAQVGTRLGSQIMDIVDMAIQVGGAREGQSFDLKI
jgi:hypothetical protein